MNASERNKLIEDIFNGQCLPLLTKKGRDYSGETDAYRNFKQLAATLGVTVDQIIYVYMRKHLDALETHMVDGKLDGESLRDKLIDIVNYSLLLYVWQEITDKT